MCGIVFEKIAGRGGTEQVFMQKQSSEVFFKKALMRNSQEMISAGKARLSRRCFLVNFAKIVTTLFSRTPPDDYF